MSEPRYTLDEVYALIATNDPDRIRVKMALATSHADRLSAVENAVDWVGREFAKTKQLRYNQSEDQLSIDFVLAMKAMGFEASHDTQYGGHCDVVVEARDGFLWIAECKIHTGYDWLFKGFDQLDTRYSTGIEGQDAGEIIIYCQNRRMDEMMAEWGARLEKERGVTVTWTDGNKLMFRSMHKHEATGMDFNIRHTGVSIYFNPKDKAAS